MKTIDIILDSLDWIKEKISDCYLVGVGLYLNPCENTKIENPICFTITDIQKVDNDYSDDLWLNIFADLVSEYLDCEVVIKYQDKMNIHDFDYFYNHSVDLGLPKEQVIKKIDEIDKDIFNITKFKELNEESRENLKSGISTANNVFRRLNKKNKIINQSKDFLKFPPPSLLFTSEKDVFSDKVNNEELISEKLKAFFLEEFGVETESLDVDSFNKIVKGLNDKITLKKTTL